jgi:quinol monooxygenase YgiN
MVTVGLLVRLVAKLGKEAEVTRFLEGGLALVQEEPATIAWFAIRLGPSEFGIFDAFLDDAGRQAHLGGQVAAALMAQAPDLLERPPVIEPVDVLAAKLPGSLPVEAVWNIDTQRQPIVPHPLGRRR